MDECQNKGDRKWAIRKRMKTKEGRKFGGDSEEAVEWVGVNGYRTKEGAPFSAGLNDS
jgi:hypothetical protein